MTGVTLFGHVRWPHATPAVDLAGRPGVPHAQWAGEVGVELRIH